MRQVPRRELPVGLLRRAQALDTSVQSSVECIRSTTQPDLYRRQHNEFHLQERSDPQTQLCG